MFHEITPRGERSTKETVRESPSPQVQLHPVVHLDDDPDDGKEHHQAPETKTEEEHESFIHGPSLPGKGKLLLADQARAATVSAQVSTVARIASAS